MKVIDSYNEMELCAFKAHLNSFHYYFDTMAYE